MIFEGRAYVVIPMSNISEIIYDTSTIKNKKSHDSFQVDTTVDDLGNISRSLDGFTSNFS